MNTKGIFAFITGYTLGYSLALATLRFTILFAVNHFLGLGLSLGVLLLVVYGAHLVGNTWNSGVAQAAQRYRMKAAADAKAKMAAVALAEAGKVPYSDLDPEHQKTLN